jgi:hypothetical protein
MTGMVKVVVVAGLLAASRAHADHQHGMETGASEDRSSLSAGLALVAATFDTLTYGGDYQGLVPAVGYARDRFAVAASLGVYRLQENGLERYGAGDVMAHGRVAIIRGRDVTAGAALGVSAPTGDHLAGFGMGHPMLMPAAWGHWRAATRVSVDGSLGYGQGIGGGDSHHDHGAWPLVEPMNRSELTWTASGQLGLAKALSVGARFGGAIPVGDGVTRMVGGVRALWSEGRVDTAFELQAGLAGDPFTLRGVLETALRF